MGYCCFCIPLTEYAIFLGCLEIISCSIYFIWFIQEVPKEDQSSEAIGILFNVLIVIVAVFLILGSIQRRHKYLHPYLILRAISVVFVFIAMGIYAIVSPATAALCLMYIFVICLLTFPIYLLYVEIKDDRN